MNDCAICNLAETAGDRLHDSILIHRSAFAEAEHVGLTAGDVFYHPDVYRAWYGRNEAETELRRLGRHHHPDSPESRFLPDNVVNLDSRRRKDRRSADRAPAPEAMLTPCRHRGAARGRPDQPPRSPSCGTS